jgi:DNA primase
MESLLEEVLKWRIPDEVIDRLKQEVSLQRLVEARGIELKRHGTDLLGLCPLHVDHEPSLVISPKKNPWHCLGACQTGGSVIDWVMKAQGVSFHHAVELFVPIIRRKTPSASRGFLPRHAQTIAGRAVLPEKARPGVAGNH